MELKNPICDADAIHADTVDLVSASMPEDDLLFDLADFFKVFGDSTRIRILYALRISEMCVCDLAVLLNMTESAISHQLRTLRQTKLVKYRREGKNVYYMLDDEHVGDIIEIAMQHFEEL